MLPDSPALSGRWRLGLGMGGILSPEYREVRGGGGGRTRLALRDPGKPGGVMGREGGARGTRANGKGDSHLRC